jgi:hypothetical protein
MIPLFLLELLWDFQSERYDPPAPQDMDKKWVQPGCLGAWLSDHMSPSRLLSDIMNFIIFQGFLVCVHYMLETVRQPLSASRSVSANERFFSTGLIAYSQSADYIRYATNSKCNFEPHKRLRSMSARQRIRNVA